MRTDLPHELPARTLVLAVRPEVDEGRYPVKRAIGEQVEVEADIVGDGHDVLRAALLHRAPGEKTWHEVELHHKGNDTWSGCFDVTTLGRHHYTVIAWVDAFATWRRGLERKHAAGTDVKVELLEGALLVEKAGLGDFAKRLRGDAPVAERVAVATSQTLAQAMHERPDRSRASKYRRELEIHVERQLAASSAWYELFPRSFGGLREAEKMLGYVAELGFDIVYLPPIHPIGRAFRKGPDNSPTAGPNDPGSPWAIGGPEGGHTAVHPQLGTMADFEHFVAAAKGKGLEVALDIAFQASPDHPWVKQHPTWFKQRPDGSIQYAENPPKKYQDVYPFDFESADWKELWAALRDVFLFWAQKGVRVFRVDNPHTKPIPFWEWCLREVSAKYPDAIFLSEAFTRPKLMYALAKSGFSQGYTYFTWRTSKWELEHYLRELTQTEVREFFRPNFWPTTPDIFPDHLVHGGRGAFLQRVILAGTLGASYGIYGPSYELMENEPRPGVEELARNEKYQVRAWNIDDAKSIRPVIARLNTIRKEHPALHTMRSLTFHRTDNDALLCYSKKKGDDVVLCVVNLDPHHLHRGWVDLDLAALGISANEHFQVHDLLGGGRYAWRGAHNFVELAPHAMPAHIFVVRRHIRTENDFEYFL
jgi:starch synthase (maltosyl-transferring)